MGNLVTIKRGDMWRQAFEVVDYNDAPIDLTGCSFWLQVRDSRRAVVFDTAESEGSLSVEKNWIFLAIDTVPVGRFKFDLQITFADGSPMSSDTYYLRVIEDVTRAD